MRRSDEISFGEITSQIQAYIRYLFSKWIIILIAGMIGGVLGLVYAFYTKPTYKADLNFVLSNNSSTSGGIMGFASQFGLNLGSGGDDAFTGDNIITLMKSRRMVQAALFLPLPDSNESLLNFYVKDNKFNEAWAESDKLNKVYPFPSSPDKMTLMQDSIFRIIYGGIQMNMLDVVKPDKNQNIYNVTTTSTMPLFSFYMTKYLVDVTSSFYISTKTSTAKNNLNMLSNEADSLRHILNGAIVTAGSQTDYTFNLNPAFQVQRSGVQQSQATATALGQAYGQVLQNLEIAKITLERETPLYQIIDAPTLPLNEDRPGKLTSIIIGGFLAGFLICGFLVVHRMYKDYQIKPAKL